MRDGNLHWRNRDLSGQTFGVLKALRSVGSNGRKMKWEFLCQCGNRTVKEGAEVTKAAKRGQTPNCGCLTKAFQRRPKSHGMSRHPLYHVWRSMLARCTRPSHPAWRNYGGRGITCCARWQHFENFFADMGCGYRTGLTLDRINNEKGYYKTNCRWATCKVNSRNSRASVIPGWALDKADSLGIGRTTLHYRLAHGWPVEKACSTPPSPTNRCTTS